MKNDNDFKPQIIGVNEQSIKQAQRAWEKFTDIACDVISDVISFLEEADIPTEQFIDLVSMDPKKTIIRLYEISGKSVENMNTAKMIEIGLITNDYAPELEKSLVELQKAKREAIQLFNFDLASLRDSKGLFTLNDSFMQELREHYTIYTQSNKENEALQYLKQIINGFNFFAEKGLISSSRGVNSIEPILKGIRTKKDKKGFEPEMNLFKIARWNVLFK